MSVSCFKADASRAHCFSKAGQLDPFFKMGSRAFVRRILTYPSYPCGHASPASTWKADTRDLNDVLGLYPEATGQSSTKVRFFVTFC